MLRMVEGLAQEEIYEPSVEHSVSGTHCPSFQIGEVGGHSHCSTHCSVHSSPGCGSSQVLVQALPHVFHTCPPSHSEIVIISFISVPYNIDNRVL